MHIDILRSVIPPSRSNFDSLKIFTQMTSIPWIRTLLTHRGVPNVNIGRLLMSVLNGWKIKFTDQTFTLDNVVVKTHKLVCNLNHISLVSFLWDIGKQCRPRSGATERGVWSGSPLFAYRTCGLNLNKMKNTTKQHLKRKWTDPSDKIGKIHSA